MRDTASLSMSRETILAVTSRIVQLVGGFVGIIVFARHLSPEKLGSYYLILSAAHIGSQLLDGVSKAIKKRISESGVQPPEYFGLGLLAFVLYVGCMSLVGLGVFLFDVVYFPHSYVAGSIAVAVTLGLSVLMNDIYAGLGYPGLSMWASTARTLLRVVLQILLLLSGFGIIGLFVGFSIANVILAAVVVAIIRIRPQIPTRGTVERTVSFAQWSILNTLFQRFYSRVDILIIGVLVGSTAVGYYEVALRFVTPAILVSISIGNSLTIKTSGLSSRNRSVKEELRSGMGYTGLLSIPIFFGSLLIAEELLTVVYSATYAPAWTALVGLALFQVVNSYRIPYTRVLDGINKPHINTRINLITIIFHLIFAYYLGRMHGLLGIVLATFSAECLRVGIQHYVSYSLFHEHVLGRKILYQVASGAVMYLAGKGLLRELRGHSDMLVVLITILLGGVVYFVSLLTLDKTLRQKVVMIYSRYNSSTN